MDEVRSLKKKGRRILKGDGAASRLYTHQSVTKRSKLTQS